MGAEQKKEKWHWKETRKRAKTEEKKERGLNRKRRRSVDQKGRKKGAEIEKGRKVRHWSWKNERARTENFSAFIFFPIFSEKIMVNSFVLDLIFSMNQTFFILGKRCNLVSNYACFSMLIGTNSLHVCLICSKLIASN